MGPLLEIDEDEEAVGLRKAGRRLAAPPNLVHHMWMTLRAILLEVYE
jgi:hypothetical protein